MDVEGGSKSTTEDTEDTDDWVIPVVAVSVSLVVVGLGIMTYLSMQKPFSEKDNSALLLNPE